MSRTNSQIVPEEQLVPHGNRLVIKKNNQRVASDSHITDTMMRFVVEILRHPKLYNPVSLTTTVPIIYLHQSDSKLHSSQDDHPITKLLNTTNGDYKFGMEVPDAIISDAIRNKAGYKYYMAKKVESEKAKIVDKPEKQHVSPIKSGRGKGFMCYGDQVENIPNKLKKDVVPRKTRSLTIDKEAVVGDDNDARYRVFMYNKSTATPNSTYLSPTVTSSSLDFIQTLLDETPANKLTYFMSHPVYTDAQTTSVVHNPVGNPKLTSYIAGASEVPLAKKIPYPTTYPQPSSLQAKAKKLMQKAKKNMRKFRFKKVVAQKFKEYDQKLEALTNFNVSEAFKKPSKKKKKHRKDVGEPSPRSSRRNRSPVVILQDDTPAMKPLDQADTLIKKHSNPKWFPKKSGLTKRSMTWFDLFLKSDINKDENHILRPSTVAIAKKFKELIQKDKLTIADFEG
ncbi:hypothetical protein Tco_0707091 [Tanacetum coccineum]|uniref:Uncharacterized protein n=1 Tax=Tanacetum coccineum TaxID=301880 RepID=A0ABQ4Y9B4_9ASTR